MKNEVVVFWFRRDLRLEDNVGLQKALNSGFPVLPIFIFDENILNQFEDKKDRRVDYIHQALTAINMELQEYGATLNTYYGNPDQIFEQLEKQYTIKMICCNRDYEPQAIQRDKRIYDFFEKRTIQFKAFKDQVIFDKHDIVKNDGLPYTVYTAYAKKWKENLSAVGVQISETNYDSFYKQPPSAIIQLNYIGFEKSDLNFENPQLDASIIDEYDKYRDYPAMQKTTQLGIALRFGTISIRKCVSFALLHNQVWLSELIWREFFMQIMYFFPQVVDRAFKSKYDAIKWRNNEDDFERWCNGQTGYPIVDAGMRQLNETGFMHNRVRMIVASFLCKHLLIDWRWGEAYFAQKLNDFDLSANNGNWQWAAGCGCDAAPYFRVFSPALQTQKFDRNLEYVKMWVAEYGAENYVQPIVEHSFARERALKVYGEALKDNNK